MNTGDPSLDSLIIVLVVLAVIAVISLCLAIPFFGLVVLIEWLIERHKRRGVNE